MKIQFEDEPKKKAREIQTVFFKLIKLNAEALPFKRMNQKYKSPLFVWQKGASFFFDSY